MLVIDNLCKQYSKTSAPALKNLSMSIAKGEFVAILGLSGAGKSTLIRCINRLIEPDDGSIFYHDKDVLQLKGTELRQYRSDIGMVFQSFNLIERLDSLSNVILGRLGTMSSLKALTFNFSTQDKNAAYLALERVGLEKFADRRVKELSGGQRQRIAIARTLMQKPKIILGDEPVASLDPLTSETILQLLKKINQEDQITMIINLHDVFLARKFADRIIGINGGTLVFDGKPHHLTDNEFKKIYAN